MSGSLSFLTWYPLNSPGDIAIFNVLSNEEVVAIVSVFSAGPGMVYSFGEQVPGFIV